MFAFSSNEKAVLDRKTDIGESSRPVSSRDIDLYYELDRCAEWAKKNELCKVMSLSLVLFFPGCIYLHDTRTGISRTLFKAKRLTQRNESESNRT
jgi:hypothetical protein